MKPFIPKDAVWYIAESVTLFQTGRKDTLVHVDFILINATTPEQAYTKAMCFGSAANAEFTNPEGETVVTTFMGLRNLHVVHDALEDGAELLFEEYADLSLADVRALIRPKERLNVFAEQ